MYILMFYLRKRLFTGTVPVNKKHLTGTVPLNKKHLTGTLFIHYTDEFDLRFAFLGKKKITARDVCFSVQGV